MEQTHDDSPKRERDVPEAAEPEASTVSPPAKRKNEYGEGKLKEQQADVVAHICAHGDVVTAVDASAGTGKTYTLIRALLRLIEQADERGEALSVDQFVFITFTNKAADELEKSLYEALQKRKRKAPTSKRALWAEQLERASGAFIGTIHSFCKGEILRPFGYDQGVARDAGVTFAGQLLDDAVRDVMEAYDAGGDGDSREEAFARWLDMTDAQEANRLRRVLRDTPSEPLFDAEGTLPQHRFHQRLEEALQLVHRRGWSTAQALTWTCEEQPHDDGYHLRALFAALVRIVDLDYRRKKDREQVLDQHDLLDRSVRLLESEEGQAAARLFGQRYRYLFIDEFQDTDQLQKRIVDALVETMAGILVVGDWKQSIYRFRGAEPQLLQDIAHDHMMGGEPFPLTVSGRPSEPLRKALNELFGSVGERFPGLGVRIGAWEPRWVPDDRVPEVIVRGAGEEEDARARLDATAGAIDDLLQYSWELPPGHEEDHEEKPVEVGDIVVLCRTNRDVKTYARGLSARGVDARPDRGDEFYQRPEIVATYRMLRLVLNPRDDAALAAALPTPYLADVDLREYEKMRVQYGMEGNMLVDKLRQERPDLLSGPSRGANGEEGVLNRLRRRVRTDTAAQVLGQLYDDFDIAQFYERHENTAALQNLQRLREVARTLAQDDQAMTLRLFSSYLRRAIAMGREEDRVASDDTQRHIDHVRVMTVHRAKGLEFPFVVIPELQSDLIEKWRRPAMIFAEEHGLDVSVKEDANEHTEEGDASTRSSQFDAILNTNRADGLEEEMRVFYVAVTRAQHSVVLIGSGETDPQDVPGGAFTEAALRDVETYAWQDEVMKAREALCELARTDKAVSVKYAFDSNARRVEPVE